MDDPLGTFATWYSVHGYWVLFLGVLLENAGLPVPGETALLAAGCLANPSTGGGLSITTVIIVAFLAAVVGDNIGYWLGRMLARSRLVKGKRFLFLTPTRFQRAEAYFARYGAVTVFIARFVTMLRIIAGPAAGAAGMPWWRFLMANTAGALVWSAVIGGLGYAAGPAWDSLQKWLGWGSWVVAGLIVLAIAGWWAFRLLRPKPREET